MTEAELVVDWAIVAREERRCAAAVVESRRRTEAQERRAANRSAMILRWAVMTIDGKNLRIYGHNRLKVVAVLKPVGERLAVAMEAGCWHEHAGHVRPDWDNHHTSDERKSGIGT